MNRIPAHRIRRHSLATALLCFVVSWLAGPVAAQDQKPPTLVTVTILNEPFPAALAIIESRIPYKFAYSGQLARVQPNISITAVDMPLADFLQKLFAGTSITWQLIGD